MNSINTGDGLCKFYVQAHRIRGMYSPYQFDTRKLDQLYSHIICISHPNTCSACTQWLGDRLKTRKDLIIIGFVPPVKYQLGNSSF